jgi:beta-glucanase (GH16 family)
MMGTDIDRSGWPLCGEMDVMEMLGQQPDTVWAHLHGPLASNSSTEYPVGTGYRAPSALTDDYHVYGLVWSPDAVVWTLDGTPYYTVRQSDLGPDRRWVYDHDFSLLLSMVVGGSWAGPPSPSTAFPATMSVDWIRIYQ